MFNPNNDMTNSQQNPEISPKKTPDTLSVLQFRVNSFFKNIEESIRNFVNNHPLTKEEQKELYRQMMDFAGDCGYG
tara:strand:- start:1270 stop:1497 length:228 start_codon:yes stop_codon:yes gene_type:complete